jgi:hypothetical protein
MKISYYKTLLFICFGINNLLGQCTPTYTDSGLHNPVCSLQETTSYSSGIIRINFSSMLPSNLYSFTTVGSSSEDTHLAFYDSSGVLLAQNDDAANWVGCKQSTIEYLTTVALNGAYVILSKKGCQELTSSTSIWYNVTNPYNKAPIIKESNTPFYACKDTTAQFNAVIGDGTAVSSPVWKSSDPSIAEIDENTGFVSFIKADLVKIYLKDTLNCEVFKTYLVVETETSAITHD